MAEVERLIVELDAKIDDYVRKMDKADKQNDKTGKSGKQMGALIAQGAKVATTSVIALGTAMSALIIASANNRQELESLSRQAKLSAGDFEALAFATKQFGINGEQIADISKDVSDRLGEFATAGTGTFQDFADVMDLSKSQAQALAIEWQNLSSDQVIGRMVEMMEGAGASGNQMTFVLESMGNDLSRLLPLFSDNSAKLKDLKGNYEDVAGALQITQAQAQELKKSAENFDLLTSSLGKAGTVISATLAPIFNDFFGDVIKVVPTATQAIVNFINSFLDAENITSIASVNKQIEEGQEKIIELQERLNDERVRGRAIVREDLNDELERLEALKQQLETLEAQKQSIEDANILDGGEITGEGGEVIDGGEIVDDSPIRLEEARKERLKELDAEYFEARAEMILANEELNKSFIEKELEEYKNLLKQKLITEGQYLDKALKLRSKLNTSVEKLEGTATVQTIKNLATIAGENDKYAKAEFKVKKALRIAEATMSTARAVTDVLPNYPLAAAVGIAGAAQIATIASTSFGGGGGGSSAAPSGGGSQQEEAPAAQLEDVSNLDVTARTEDTQQTLRVVIGTDDGRDLIDTIGTQIKQAGIEGRL